MTRINLLLTLSSLNVLLVTLERFSFTTRILLQPYSFLRLHEVFQICTLILFTVLIPFFLLREVSNNFEILKTKKGLTLAVFFIIGIYFYATGNGLHEVASFTFNQYCDTKVVTGELCGGLFFNDYYTGNILYFLGAVLMNIPLLLLEKINPGKNWKKKDMAIMIANALFYSLAIFAYSAFDRVLVGLYYSAFMTAVSLYLWFKVRGKSINYPLTTYTAIAYTVGTLASLLIRFR